MNAIEIKNLIKIAKTAKKEKVKPSSEELDEEALQEQYKNETGKNAIWRGKVTKGYLEWKTEK